MKAKKIILASIVVAALIIACCCLAACNGTNDALDDAQIGVVKAFGAISPAENVLTQTAVLSNDKYIVTVITSDYVSEYVLGKDLKISSKRDVLGSSAALAAAEGGSALERAYAEALAQSGIDEANVTGFDFDRDTYMGKPAYKVEIEEAGAKYKYVFDISDFSVLDSEIEFENDKHFGSYIDEATAMSLALSALNISESAKTNAVIRSEVEDGRRQYKLSFDFEGYRYDVTIDAANAVIVKLSKSVLANVGETPALPQAITVDEAKQIALGFVFPNGAEGETYSFRKVKLDYEDGQQFVFEVELVAKGSEYEFEIAANGGGILDVEIDVEKSTRPSTTPSDARFITRDEALSAVRTHLAGQDFYLIEIEIEKEGVGSGRRYFYEVEVRLNGAKREFRVDAVTGEVTEEGAPQGEEVVTEEQTVEIAISAFGLDAQTITQRTVKLEREDGVLCFTVKLYVGTKKYEAEINAVTGTVLKREVEGGSPAPANIISKEQAITNVKEVVGANAVVGEVELESENGRYVYEIEVIVGGIEYDYFVDAVSGAVSKNNDFVSGGVASISEEQALEIALKEFGLEGVQVTVVKIKLEREKGRPCYDVEFFNNSLKYEIEIDATTGAVLEKDVSYD